MIPFPLAVRPSSFPRPDSALAAVVIIPARNEADLLPEALRALRGQVDPRGRLVDPRTFEVLVLANNCTDGTADLARAIDLECPDGPAIRVAEVDLPPAIAHVGTARRWLMDQAADRLEAVGRPDGLILSTDADTVVAPNWIAAQWAEVADGADAVAGRIEVSRAELLRLEPSIRRRYVRELVHRARVLQLEALIDPDPLDRPPRHDFHGGASFGITARAYRQVGGLPPLRSLEDVALAEALWRVDARFVHSPKVWVRTSSRLDARADGGLGRSLADGEAGAALFRTGEAIVAELGTRAALRQLFRLRQETGSTAAVPGADLDRVAQSCGLTSKRLTEVLVSEATFGRWLEAIWGFGSGPPRRLEPRVPLKEANRGLREEVRRLRRATRSG